MTSQPSESSRRIFLRGSLATAAFAGFGQAFGISAPVARPDLDHAPVLRLAATAEALSVTFYQHALSGATFALSQDARRQLQAVLAAEQSHLELLASLGGTPLTEQFALPGDMLSDAGVFADTALHLEQVCTGAYIAASHQFAVLGRPERAATASTLRHRCSQTAGVSSAACRRSDRCARARSRRPSRTQSTDVN